MSVSDVRREEAANGEVTLFWKRDGLPFEVRRGDEVRVRITQYPQYALRPWPNYWEWCPVELVVAGDAAPYPIRVRLPDGAPGQFAPAEVLDVRTPAAEKQLREVDAEVRDTLKSIPRGT